MKRRTIVSKNRKCFIKLLHRDSDPGVWIVQRWEKTFWFKKRISSNWFIDGSQALAFAKKMEREHMVF